MLASKGKFLEGGGIGPAFTMPGLPCSIETPLLRRSSTPWRLNRDSACATAKWGRVLKSSKRQSRSPGRTSLAVTFKSLSIRGKPEELIMMSSQFHPPEINKP
jgi:hypothetical protein